MSPAPDVHDDPMLSAEVLLAPAEPPAAGTPVTAATIERFQPDPEGAERCRRAFVDLGLEVGERVGASFSISGTRSAFERAFDTSIAIGEDGTVRVGDGGDCLSLPTEALPDDVREMVRVVSFTPPPTFELDR